MPAISSIFNQSGAAFVLLRDGIKFPPIEDGWQNKGHAFQETATHKGNVGLMAGNGYVGLDQDQPEAFQGITLPDTTTWETRPGRLGMWFVDSDNGNKPNILAKYGKKADQAQLKLFKDGESVGEVKLERTYQVIPPSWKTLEDGQRADYKLLQEIAPAEISLEWLLSELQRLGITFQKGKDKSKVIGPAKQAYANAAIKDELHKLGLAHDSYRLGAVCFNRRPKTIQITM